ncbi:methyl-accepting chemotaxis protein [Paenibacillus hodogayensis]|uniref:Methyl-accepting chemotaxis protein n=1 Tax=Paenibacillus hodogayensis TaxID=279208 RepID=A0ABV5W392_9BACL
MRSLQTRILLLFSTLVLLAGCVLSYSLYTSSANLIRKSIGDQAKTIAAHAAHKIDADAFRAMRADSDDYKKLRLLLNDMKETNGLKYLYTMAEKTTDGRTEYVYVVDGAPLEETEDVSEFGAVESKPYVSLSRAFAEQREQVGELSNDDRYGATVTAYVPIIDKSGKMVGLVGADFDGSEVYARLRSNTRSMLLITACVLIAAVAATWLFARILVSPLKRLTRALQLVQAGDLTVQVDASRKDEIGVVSRAFQQMVGDLSDMIRAVRDNARQLNEASRELSLHAGQTAASGNSITSGIREVAGGAAVQMQRSAETAGSMEEVSGGVQRIAESSASAAEASLRATAEARRGNLCAGHAMERMTAIAGTTDAMADEVAGLERRSAEVGSIVSVMAHIAAETHLLALNAAIEAARAGEQGRGFAVVADQVRKLASQAEESSRQIAGLVEGIVAETASVAGSIRAGAREVHAGADAVREADAAFRVILTEVERVASQVQEVSATSEQMAAGSEQVSAAIDEMAAISREAARHYRDIAESSDAQLSSIERMNRSTGALYEMAAQLNRAIERFRI